VLLTQTVRGCDHHCLSHLFFRTARKAGVPPLPMGISCRLQSPCLGMKFKSPAVASGHCLKTGWSSAESWPCTVLQQRPARLWPQGKCWASSGKRLELPLGKPSPSTSSALCRRPLGHAPTPGIAQLTVKGLSKLGPWWDCPLWALCPCTCWGDHTLLLRMMGRRGGGVGKKLPLF